MVLKAMLTRELFKEWNCFTKRTGIFIDSFKGLPCVRTDKRILVTLENSGFRTNGL